MLYVLGDADRVREKVEALLFANDLAALATFSQTLTQAVSTLVREMGERLGARTVMAGGDDVLFTVSEDRFDLGALHLLSKSFTNTTGCSISFGVGTSLEAAYLNLRRAKAAGGGIVSRGLGK
jgi:hypothetical protein